MAEHPDYIAQVVPDLATFAVDDGFAYRIPPELEGLGIGSIVRIPLGSRRMRGYVVSTRRGDAADLKPVISVSGDHPVFDEKLLQTLRWAALHYVAPLAVLLGRAAPPNLPRGKASATGGDLPQVDSPLPEISAAAASGTHVRPACLVQSRPYETALRRLAAAPVAAGRNVAVVVPTVEEAETLAGELRAGYGERVVLVSSSIPAKEATRHWVTTRVSCGRLIVGTAEIALWPLGSPALWLVVEEARRAMKAKQTPTLQVRDVVRRRALVERSAMVLVGAVPTLDTLARGATVAEPPGRVWPLVELIDRGEEPPSGRPLTARTVQAIAQTVKRRGRVFVFVSRRGYAPAFRCVRCRTLRRCPNCGAGPDRGDDCRRCGTRLGPCRECGGRRFEPLGAAVGRVIEQLQKRFGQDVAGHNQESQITVGSERDIPSVPASALSVAVDADSLLLAPHYRAEEDALRLLVRVAATVARGRGQRCLVQTAQPGHRVLTALRHGHPLDCLHELSAERERNHFPPAAELLAIEVGSDATSRHGELAAACPEGLQLHGPEFGGGRTRWFLQGDSLQAARVRLRSVVQQWRDAGLKVRVDADPIDL